MRQTYLSRSNVKSDNHVAILKKEAKEDYENYASLDGRDLSDLQGMTKKEQNRDLSDVLGMPKKVDTKLDSKVDIKKDDKKKEEMMDIKHTEPKKKKKPQPTLILADA